jgi:uncharacterized membrane protein YhfC
MDSFPTLSTTFLATMAISLAFVVAYPLLLGFLAHRRLGVSWRYFLFGAAIFFVFQLLTRVPALQLLQPIVAPYLRTSDVLLWTWFVFQALSAGVFEEVGRYVGYRVFMGRQDKTWSMAVMYGLGHGGLESMLLVGGTLLVTLINLLAIRLGGPESIPPDQRDVAAQQIQSLASQPVWVPLLGAWERLWTVPIQVAFSVLVLQAFRRHNLAWLWLAIAAHALVDLISVGLSQLLGPSISTTMIVEGAIAAFGVVAVWLIWRLRDTPMSVDSQAG